MKLKLSLPILTLVALFTFIGCKQQGDQPNDTTPTDQTQTTTGTDQQQ